MMKRFLCAILAVMMIGCVSVALAEQCKYAGQGSPCEPGWWVDTEERMHARACFYHVEDKEDVNSHVLITPWTSCTLDEGGECTGCGWDYDKSDNEPSYDESEMYMLEFYMMLSEEYGTAPVDVSTSGSSLSIAMKDDFFTFMEDMGVPVSETMMVKTKYTLNLPGGNSYPATGEAVTPEATVTASEYGPGAWMEKYGLIEIGKPVYENNVAPGTATVKVEISVENGSTYTLTKNFTITGAAAERLPGDADGDKEVSLEDALDLLRVLSGETVSINTANADVTGDGAVDLQDVLLILQYLAGWNVSLK